MPLLSIILPVFNVEKYLNQSLKSLLTLLKLGVQLIIVDDGSTDSSPLIADTFQKENPQFDICIVHQKNKGLSGARNSGFPYATGKYIWFIDSDDCIIPDMSHILVNELNKCNVDILVLGRIIDYGENKEELLPYHIVTDSISGLEYLDKALTVSLFRTNVWDKIYRRQFLIDIKNKFVEELLYEDMLYNLEAFTKANSVKDLQLPIYIYNCTNQSSITKSIRLKDLDVLTFAGMARTFLQTLNPTKITKHAYNILMFTWISSCLVNKYVSIYKTNNEAQYILNRTFKDPVFISSASYCAHGMNIPTRVRIFAIIFNFSKSLYRIAVSYGLLLKKKYKA